MTETLVPLAANIDPSSGIGEAFARDPFAVLAQESCRLIGVYHDPNIDAVERARHLDGYFRTVESLDRAIFPDMDGAVQDGVPPGYLPDGFRDMGTVGSLNPTERYNRAMNYVDTYNTLDRHRAVFEYMFTNWDPAQFGTDEGELVYQQTAISNIARQITETMPIGEPTPAERGGVLPISGLNQGMCQNHALTAQVLMQAFGIRSRLSKNYFADQRDIEMHGQDYAGSDHVSNVVTIGKQRYMFDATNPQANERGEWTPGLFRMDHQNPEGAWMITERNGQRRRNYTERNNMFWTVQRQS